MYSCRKFLGLFLTGLFLTGLFASSDLLMNNPQELNQNDKIKSIAPAVDSKEARVLPMVKTDIDSMVKAKYLASQEATVKALPNASEKQPNNRDCTDCVYDWSAYGSECCDSAWDEFAIDCATLEANYGWDCTGCLCPGDLTCEEQGLVDCPEGSAEACAATLEDCVEDPNADCTGNAAWIADGYCDTSNNNEACAWDGGDCCGSTCVDATYECGTDASSWSACNSECLDPSANDDCCADFSCDFYAIVCGDGTCDGGEDYYTCPEDCNAPGECDPGFVVDCVDTDCCPESWIGDGFEDCEDQQYGCDLTCYDNDGGDCAGGTTTGTTTTGGTADCEDCVYDWTNYGSECCDTAWTEFGIDCATLEANYGWDCSGCACPGDGPAVCGDGACTGDEDYYTCPEDCNAPGECDPGFVVDCVDTDCCPESWIGDGFEDCEDQQYGCDLTCYDNDGGDCAGGTTTGTTTTGGTADCEDCVYDFTNYGSECCDTAWTEFGIDCATLEANYAWDCTGCACPGDGPSCEDQGQVTCWDGSCADSAGDCPDEPVVEAPTGVCATGSSYAGYPSVTLTWDTAPSVCGDGVCGVDEDYYTCPEDCNAPGECDPGFVVDCVDTDCCPESWIGDGFEDCEDQQYGCDLTCYDNDGGDCAGGTTTGTTTTGGTADCEDCVYDFTNYGSECCDTAWTEFGIDCATLEANYSWDCTGCACPGDGPAVCGDGACTGDEDYYTCPEDCNAPGVCDPGFVVDCVDNDCCPESWIGDGFEDCEDQQYGCDLTCYDNDGGDCAGGTTTGTTTTGGGSPDCDDCVYDWTNYGSECCDTAWTEFGIDCATLAANYGWDCTGCRCPGDAGRSEETRQLPVKTKEGSAYSTTSATFIGDVNEIGTRDDIYVVGLSCDACLAGEAWSGSFNATPELGEYTVYGFDLNSEVTATLQSCTTAGACSDIVEVGTVIAGDATSQECAEGGGDGCDQAAGDSNNDGTVNVLDVVGIVNHILAGGNGLEGCDLEVADFNGDETVNVLDVVAIVNLILAGGGRTADATDAVINTTSNSVSISANGYIGGVQMTLSHGLDFSINLTDNAYVAEYITNGNSTTLIVINPEDEVIFTSNGNFDVEEVLVTNSEEFINVVDASLEFSLSNAYPNPFNPTTTIELNLAEASYASVKVFNLKGEVVGVLMDGMVDANTYTMTWDASNLSSGVYMIRAEAGGQIATQKVMLIK